MQVEGFIREEVFGELGLALQRNSPIDLQKPTNQKKNGQLLSARVPNYPIVNGKASREGVIG